MKLNHKIVIVGGGLSGLTASILLSQNGFNVTLIEKKKYPFHRVCGEYVSNEVLPFLNSIGIYPNEMGASQIKNLVLSSVNGNFFKHRLDLGGFGLSRYLLDNQLFEKANKLGVHFLLEQKVNDIRFDGVKFDVQIDNQISLQADLVIGAFGKRANLDQKLQRNFFYQRSPYLGVKYHIKTDFYYDTIQLDNFENGYSGINKIEDDLFCLCYLTHNSNLKKWGSIPEMEKQVLYQNKALKRLFQSSDFVYDKPETINEISFEKKPIVHQHILMSGDAAGMITPLCGNGMAMAIHSAKIVSNVIISFANTPLNMGNRLLLEKTYIHLWQKQFQKRLYMGRKIQQLFGNNTLSDIAIQTLNYMPSLGKFLIKKTHGNAF